MPMDFFAETEKKNGEKERERNWWMKMESKEDEQSVFSRTLAIWQKYVLCVEITSICLGALQSRVTKKKKKKKRGKYIKMPKHSIIVWKMSLSWATAFDAISDRYYFSPHKCSSKGQQKLYSGQREKKKKK